MTYLVTLRNKDFLACFIAVNLLKHPVRVEMGKLYRKGLECVTLRDVVFNSHLELLLRKAISAYAFEFVVCHSGREEVGELGVPLGPKVVVVTTHRPDLVT